VTSGDDNKCIVWDVINRRMKKSWEITSEKRKAPQGGASSMSNKAPSQCSRAVCVFFGFIICACNDGSVRVFDPATLQEIKVLRHSG
jgi:hypothetical protein